MQQVRIPQGGLNTDDSIEIISPEDWTYAANIMSGRSYAGKSGEIENIMGTTLIDTSTWTDANSKLIGVIRSAEDDINFLFYYNTNPAKHCILKLQGTTASLVVNDSGLNFQPDKEYRINGGGLVDDLLYFTDNFNEPRCIRITKYTILGQNIKEDEDIFHIKRAPLFAPDIDESSFSAGTGKAIEDVQFACQYEYEDGQLSVISPWTRLVRGYGEDGVAGPLTQVSLRLNSVEITPNLARKVKFVARKGNDGTPFYWSEESRVSDLLDFERTLYEHDYTEQNTGVVPTQYLKDHDLVPRTAKASCVTKSRAWFANYLEGYDTPKSGVNLTFELENTTSLNDEGPTFGPNSRYQLGVVFHDNQGRSCGVLDRGWELSTGQTVLRNSSRKHLKYRITGTPPSWAHSYSLVMTKDVIKTFFINGSDFNAPGGEIFVNVDASGTETYTDTIQSNTKYIRLSTRIAQKDGIFYNFHDGDYAIITDESSGVIYGPLKVISVSGQWVYVDMTNATELEIPSGNYHFQIYTPNNNTTGLYYELSRRKVVAGSLDTTDYYIYGDCVNIDINRNGTGETFFLPQMNSKPHDGSWNTDIGKPFIKTNLGEVNKKTFIRYSSPFIEGTNVNGLSEFNTGDENKVPFEAVEVQKLIPTLKEASDGDVLLAICNSNTYSVYMEESRLSTNDGSFLVASTNVIGDVRKQRSGFGTLHPESVWEEDGYVYWYDHLSRSFCRYASNGIFPISEYKAVNYFEEQAEQNSSSDEVLVGYDPFYKMIYVTFKNASSETKKTIGWSARKERWISFYDFVAESAPITGYITGSKYIYSVVVGTLRIHNNDTNFNTFSGTEYSSIIDLSFNDGPDQPKEWNVLQLNVSPNFYSFSNAEQVIATNALRVDISNRHGQETSILYNEFNVDENMVYGEIRGDENSSGGILEGDPIYSNTAQVRITFSGTTYKQLLMTKMGFKPSRGHVL